MEKSKEEKKMSRLPFTTLSKCNNNKHNMVFYRYGKKYNEIKLTKNKMDLNNRKMKSPPIIILIIIIAIVFLHF